MNPKPSLMAELIAEFLGTFVLMLLGIGVVAMVVLFPTKNPGEIIHGGFTNITDLRWGLAVTMGIYIAGKVSGAHLNPAVTLALAVFRGFPWIKGVAIFHCADRWSICRRCLRLLELLARLPPSRSAARAHRRNLHHVPGTSRAIPSAGFLDQLIGTALLVLLIFAITDEFNAPPGANLAPAMIGLSRGRHRHELWRHARLCHQSRTRLWPPTFYRRRGLSEQWPHRWNPRVVDSSWPRPCSEA